MHKRSIVFSVDNNYNEQLFVVINSLFNNCNNELIKNLYIIHSHDYKETYKNDLIILIQKFCFTNIHFISDLRINLDFIIINENDHVTKATYYRLFLCSLIPVFEDSILYMDIDTLIIDNIDELLKLNITRPIASVSHFLIDESKRLFLSENHEYFQAGIILINLKLWRIENYEELFIRILKNDYNLIKWWDQDVLNLAFKDNWDKLPIGYNVHSKVLEKKLSHTQFKIIHFDGSNKPWKRLIFRTFQSRWFKEYYDTFQRKHKYDNVIWLILSYFKSKLLIIIK